MKNLALLSKRGIISLLFVFMVILTLQDAIAQTITIGSTSSTRVSTYFPLSRRALYNRCEIIYTKAEINTAGAGAGNISQISFYKNASETSLDITAVKVYMKHTTSSTLSSGSWSTTGYTLVFSGTVTNSNAAGWKTINLSTPFAYNNVDNLEIAIDHGSQNTSTSYPSWKYTSTASNTVRYAYGSTAPTTLSTVTYARPVIQMVFASSALTANAGTDKSICSGNSTTLTATASGGTSPYNYLWSTGANTASISVSPASTTTYTVTVTDAASSTANDNVVVNVTTSVTPSVSISANPSGTVIPGNSVTYTATPTNGGTPSYQWKKGGVNISGATSSTYTYTPADGDVISCSMTSTASCANPTTVTSNSLTMAVRVASSLPEGTLGQTLRHDGTDWVANSLLFNNGTNVGIGTTVPSQLLHVKTPGNNGSTFYTVFLGQNSTGYQNALNVRVKDNITDIAADYVGTIAIPTYLTFSTRHNAESLTERMRINSSGNVGIGTTNPLSKFQVGNSVTKVSLGDCYGETIGWGTSYIGFNASRTDAGTWTSESDGGNNGGFLIYGTIGGDLNFSTIPRLYPGGTSNQTDISDATINNNTVMKISMNKFVDIGKNHTKVSIGGLTNNAELGYSTSYIGFNAYREEDINHRDYLWHIKSDGAHNGGGVIMNSIGGNMLFIPINSNTSGSSEQILDENNALDPLDFYKRRVMEIWPATYSNTSITSYGGLSVNGKIKAREIEVTLTDWWADFVFDENYKLTSLDKVEKFIQKNKHLPDVPSANVITANGYNLSEMDATLLKKIEELTLYIIEQNKKIENLQKKVEVLENK